MGSGGVLERDLQECVNGTTGKCCYHGIEGAQTWGKTILGGIDDPVLRIKPKESILKKVIRRARPRRKGFLAAGVLVHDQALRRAHFPYVD